MDRSRIRASWRALIAFLLLIVVFTGLPASGTAQTRGEVRIEGRWLTWSSSPYHSHRYDGTLVVRGSLIRRWSDGAQAVAVEPFLRVDAGGERHRFDFRSLSWSMRRTAWEIEIGMREIFWGVTESGHLIDVINQRDPEVSGEAGVKFGQPMLRVRAWPRWGTVDLVLMPVFRERPFAGSAGALWSPIPVDDGEPQFEWGPRLLRPASAIRWSQTLGAWDLGLTYFKGTNRQPRLQPGRKESGRKILVPHYDEIDQLGIDAQLTAGSWLWKLETATLDPEEGRYVAAVGGLEYVFADYFSIFVEYLFDGRGDGATTSFEDDLYSAVRLLLPDGSVQAGGYTDRESLNAVLFLRVDRRLSDAVVIGLEARAFLGRDEREPPHARRQHTSISLTATRHF